MKILFANFRMCFPFFKGGDGLYAHYLLAGLTKFHNYESQSIGLINDKREISSARRTEILKSCRASIIENEKNYLKYELDSVQISLVPTSLLISQFIAILDSFRPNVVIVSEENSEEFIEICYKKRITVILLVLHSEWDVEEIKSISIKTAAVVHDSQYTFNKYKNHIFCQNHVVHGTFDWDKWVVEKQSGKYISMLNPIIPKGGEIFYQIVKNLPHISFLAHEGWYKPNIPFEKLGNFKWSSRKYDQLNSNFGLSFLLQNTRLLLVPSICEDAFPSIIVQSLKNGIPIIGSRIGGIPEGIGDAGQIIEEFDNPDAWVVAIQKIEGDSNLYDYYRKNALEQGKGYVYQNEVGKFQKIIQNIIAN